jgi:hypothetical protein
VGDRETEREKRRCGEGSFGFLIFCSFIISAFKISKQAFFYSAFLRNEQPSVNLALPGHTESNIHHIRRPDQNIPKKANTSSTKQTFIEVKTHVHTTQIDTREKERERSKKAKSRGIKEKAHCLE